MVYNNCNIGNANGKDDRYVAVITSFKGALIGAGIGTTPAKAIIAAKKKIDNLPVAHAKIVKRDAR